tara:strand:- start:91 stop:321 length:231 start_codon:yes stop_codon:yes gene_type:complete
MTTTDDLVSSVLFDIRQLVEWAEADIEQAIDLSAKSDLADAKDRLNYLNAADKLLRECTKFGDPEPLNRLESYAKI